MAASWEDASRALPSSPSNAVTVVPFLNLMPLHQRHSVTLCIFVRLTKRKTAVKLRGLRR